MASEECVASSCASAFSSGTAPSKICILDGRTGFRRMELDYNPDDTFRSVFERAQLDSPVDESKDTVLYTMDQNQQTLSAVDYDCKLSDKGFNGTAKIVIKGSHAVKPDDAFLVNVTGTHQMIQEELSSSHDIIPHEDQDDDFDVNNNDNDNDSDMADIPDDAPAGGSFLDEIRAKGKEKKSDVVFRVDQEREKKSGLGKVVDNPSTTTTSSSAVNGSNACCNEEIKVSSYDSRSATGFAGLNNQGATCYMNSLIQSLYMNPEFRKLVYDWSFDKHFESLLARRRAKNPNMTKEEEEKLREEKEKNSIPLQLQSLFAQMQLTQARSVSTKKLTKSFGWDATDSFTQHDVTELRQVLFEALEQAMAGTDQATLIKDLFEGEVLEYVRCLGCNHENVKSVPLYEVLLDIKVFGESEAVKSIEEAMRKFITPEVLDEDNLYNCEACGKKCRAVKGTRFKRIPYFLMMQMKRFDFDFATMNRVKLCDRVTFPSSLNIADYVEGGKIDRELMAKATGKTLEELEKKTGDDDEVKDDEESEDHKPEAEAEEEEAPAASAAAEATPDAAAAAEAKANDETETADDGEKDMYDLFAILIHSGGANGGHYYAYIKDYRSGKWFEFNDSTVSEINESDIEGVFGKDASAKSYSYNYYYSNNSYGTTAYMLMYRKVDPKRNMLPPSDDEVPQALRDYVEKANAEEAERKRREKLEREMCHITVTYNGEKKKFDKHQSVTVGQLKADVMKEFKCEVASDDARLMLYDSWYKTESPLDDADTLEKSDITSWKNELTLQTKQPGEVWVTINPNDITIHIYYEQLPEGNEEAALPELKDMKFASIDVVIDKYSYVSDLRQLIADKLELDVSKLRLMKLALSSYDKHETLVNDNDSLSYSYIRDDDVIYVEICDNPLELATLAGSRVFRYMDDNSNKVTYHIYIDDKKAYDVVFDQRDTLQKLREMISEKSNIPVDNVVLKRGTATYKTELKNMQLTPKEAYVYNKDNIYVENGVVGAHNVTLYLWRPKTNSAEFLFRMKVVEAELFSVFVENATKKYIEEFSQKAGYPIGKDSSCYAIREYVWDNEFPGAFYNPLVRLDKAVSYINEDKKFMLDVLDEPLQLPEPSNRYRVFVYEWHPSTLTVDQFATEVVVDNDHPINDFRRTLAALHHEVVSKEEKKEGEEAAAAAATTTTPEVVEESSPLNPENVCIYLMRSYGRIHPPPVEDMIKAGDEAPSWEEGETKTPHDMRQIFLRNGIGIAFWNGKEPLKEMTKEDRERINKTENQQSTYSSYSSGYSSYWSRKEKGITIHVDKDEDDDDAKPTDATKMTDDGQNPPAAASAAAESAASEAPVA